MCVYIMYVYVEEFWILKCIGIIGKIIKQIHSKIIKSQGRKIKVEK